MQKMQNVVSTSLVYGSTMIFLSISGCGSKSSSSGTPTNLPLVAPAVARSVPKGIASSTRTLALTGSLSDIKSRFFELGPTSISCIMSTIDGRIAGINRSSASTSSACVSQAPVSYSIAVPGGPVAFYAQCYQTLENATIRDPELIQFGVKDGITYLYVAVGTGRVAVISTPIADQPGKYKIRAWLSVGTLNPSWDSGSYGVIQLATNENALTFEMSVAGLGIGYCGAQLKSDGTSINFTGSTDMGSTCAEKAISCVAASDASSPATCGTGVTTFELIALGRTRTQGKTTTFAASLYPVSPNVTLNGEITDDVFFGPNAPTAGVGIFTGAKSEQK